MKIDLSGPVKTKLDKKLIEAKQFERDNKIQEASMAYKNVSELMAQYGSYALTRADELRRLQKAKQYRDYAEALSSGKIPSESQKRQDENRTSSGKKKGPGQAYDQEIAALIHKSKVTWDKIGGLRHVKNDIKFSYGLALAVKPAGVALSGWKRILFYGPPGTGKTLLAAATSNGLGATFFNVKVSNIMSKYFGESTKIITSLFDAARSEADERFAVVFIDEIDSITMSRDSGNESGAERRMLSTLLSELDGLSDKGEDSSVLTIAATNTPWDLDNAVLSRFQKRIYIPLPDYEAREAILKMHITGNGHKLEYPLGELINSTEWFSGRDIERLCNQVVNIMVEDMNREIPDIVDEGRNAIIRHKIKIRPLQKKDFQAAFDRIRVDVNKYKEDKAKFDEFALKN